MVHRVARTLLRRNMFGNHLFGGMTEDEIAVEIADELADMARTGSDSFDLVAH